MFSNISFCIMSHAHKTLGFPFCGVLLFFFFFYNPWLQTNSHSVHSYVAAGVPSLLLADDFSVSWPCRNSLLPFCYKAGQDNISQSKYLISLRWVYLKIHVSINTCWNTHLEKYWRCPYWEDICGYNYALPFPCIVHWGGFQGQRNSGFPNVS